MADPTADNPELAVDELRRKARRRLIGAVVLALAAATLLPLLLEQDPRPLGDDVSVQIPPIDDSKFVSRLEGDKGKAGAPPPKSEGTSATAPGPEAKPEPKAGAKVEPKAEAKMEPKAEAKVEPKAEAKVEPKAEAKMEPKAEAKMDPRVDAKAQPRTEAKAEPKVEAKVEPREETKTEPKAAAPEASAPAASAPGPDATSKVEGFVVQLGAFTDVYGANALANRLKKAGYPAYTEPIETSRGKFWRVRVGGYPSRAAAAEARDRLKADGHNGLVSTAAK